MTDTNALAILRAEVVALAHWTPEQWAEVRGGDPIARTLNAVMDLIDFLPLAAGVTLAAPPAPDKALDVERLARALAATVLMQRYAAYANGSPTLRHGTPEFHAKEWAPFIAREYAVLDANPVSPRNGIDPAAEALLVREQDDPAPAGDERLDVERLARYGDALDALQTATLWVYGAWPQPSEQAAESWSRKARSGIIALRAALDEVK